MALPKRSSITAIPSSKHMFDDADGVRWSKRESKNSCAVRRNPAGAMPQNSTPEEKIFSLGLATCEDGRVIGWTIRSGGETTLIRHARKKITGFPAFFLHALANGSCPHRDGPGSNAEDMRLNVGVGLGGRGKNLLKGVDTSKKRD